MDIEKKRQRERVKVINQQQIAMKEAVSILIRVLGFIVWEFVEAQREEAMQEYIKEMKCHVERNRFRCFCEASTR